MSDKEKNEEQFIVDYFKVAELLVEAMKIVRTHNETEAQMYGALATVALSHISPADSQPPAFEANVLANLEESMTPRAKEIKQELLEQLKR